MKCYKCKCSPVESRKAFYPIEPKGTENRKWSCDECISETAYDSVPDDLKVLIGVIGNKK